jgi:hypothetical protein
LKIRNQLDDFDAGPGDNFEVDLQIIGCKTVIHLTLETDKWRFLVNLRFSQQAGNFMTQLAASEIVKEGVFMYLYLFVNRCTSRQVTAV